MTERERVRIVGAVRAAARPRDAVAPLAAGLAARAILVEGMTVAGSGDEV
jgi:hypothetical protein